LVNFLATITVISVGLLALIGLVSAPGTSAATVADFLLRLVSVTAGVAVIVGLLNLFAVHLGRFVRSERGWPYSIIVLLTALAVIVVRVLDRAEIWPDDLEGEQVSAHVFEAVQVSLESALAALVFVYLVYAAYRLMRRDVTIWRALFVVTAVIVLLGWIPLDNENAEALAGARDWLVQVPVGAGARGILIGVGLGTVTVGVRLLTGQDRSFRD
jgi:hypothetical protein